MQINDHYKKKLAEFRHGIIFVSNRDGKKQWEMKIIIYRDGKKQWEMKIIIYVFVTVLETENPVSNIFHLYITSFIIIATKGHLETEFEKDFFRAKCILSLFPSLSGQIVIEIVKLLVETEITRL